jgi:2-succinyl-5-enolpyruvyl-6-hydroxy-3-cyclohexene-1-carboxylate synthase
VRIVIINNDGGGIFGFLPQAEGLPADEFEALLGTPRSVDVSRAAELFDLPHHRVEALSDLSAALAAGTGLIEVRADRQANVELHQRLGHAVSEAIAR